MRFGRGLALVTLLGLCSVPQTAQLRRRPLWRRGVEKAAPPSAAMAPFVSQPRLFLTNAGRLDWYKGEKHELIVFDSVTEGHNTELFVIQPDGSGRRCITCSAPIPKGFVGQPAWHPDGEHIVIQVESVNSQHRFYNHMSWGVDEDLWLIRRDGSQAERIWDTPRFGAALHPHFNAAGNVLIWAERISTGRGRPLLRALTPNGENQWEGWRIHIADVDLSQPGTRKLSHHRTIQPNGPGFYETHGFAPDGRILYSYTPDGLAYIDDVYSARPDGSDPVNLTNSPSTWDEHGQYSPNGRYFTFMSSRFDPKLVFPGSRPRELHTELFIQPVGGAVYQATRMNEIKGERVAVSDYDWDRASRRIAFQVGVMSGAQNPDMWMVDVGSPGASPSRSK